MKLITDLTIWEISVVTYPANPDCVFTVIPEVISDGTS